MSNYARTSSNEEKCDKADTELEQIEQSLKILIYTYGFDPAISRRAVNAISDPSDVTSAYNWILDQDKKYDQGGPVYPKTNCPHVIQRNDFDLSQTFLLNLSQNQCRNNTFSSLCCSYFHELEHVRKEPQPPTKEGDGYPFVDDLGKVTCPPGENWICLDCGVIRCSRYVNGHALEHFQYTSNMNRKRSSNSEKKMSGNHTEKEETMESSHGHCLAVSLADLSVWCYECESYVVHDSLDPIVQKLQEMKFTSEE